MDYYSMTFILGVLFWVLAAIVCVGFLGWVYTQIIYMLLTKKDFDKEKENEFNNNLCEEEENIDNQEEV